MKLLKILILSVFVVACKLEVQTPKASEVFTLTKKVADWQIDNFDNQGEFRALPPPEERQPWQHRDKYHDLEWLPATFYAGLFQFHTIADNPKYTDWLRELGRKYDWRLHHRMYHADDHAVGQFYLSLAEYYKNNQMKAPVQAQFDSIMNSERGQKWQWTWCDALFMAPPVWARLAKITDNASYLNYMDQQYRMTYDSLWDEEEQLFFRDKSYLNQTEKNGEKLFWARGNGWVFGGLALMIPDLPEDWEQRSFYTDIFVKMAETVKETQREDGTWSAGLLGNIDSYPTIETSGSSFFAFGLAWGINNGLLDRAMYEPTLFRAWEALEAATSPEGLLGFVQPVGAAPGESYAGYTELYGVGAFLAAGSELYKYLLKYHPESQEKSYTSETLFMHNGGWCWYQDPRAIITKDKLIIGGVDGQNGDVRLGVFDLRSKSITGSVTLYESFQADDHNAPALYNRPDGSVLAVWAGHATENAHHYAISSSEDLLKWNERKSFVHDYKHPAGVTYMNLFYLKDDQSLYNFFRDGPTFNPYYIKSQDHGESWGNRTHFIANEIAGRHRPYVRYSQKDQNTIGISYTDGHPRRYGNSLYYAEFRDGVFRKADGSIVKRLSEGPLLTSEGEKIYTGSETTNKPYENESVPYSAWTCAMATDKAQNTHIGYSLYINNDDHRFRIASWNGNAWIDREIAFAGKCLYSLESSYTGLMTFDPENPSQVYISTDVNPTTGVYDGGKHEIYTANIKANDDISSIKWTALTTGSQYRNIRPVVVANNGYKVLLWLNGPWGNYTDYDVNVIGRVLSEPQQ